MKHGTRLTLKEKKHLTSYSINPDNWLVSKRDGDMLTLRHRLTDEVKHIPKP
ncbi:DUF6906 family protein [Aureibacillus halotolerans]|uniref:DUF6906 domain-containing protein n=1 Tax=Aureibacillus halotolerans TaxID=1508390 RepID=A0A4V3D587_9BACI|nr:hypothetical protein [Aureibacillus halotolerans]TDQ39197.1 hypothetical protein EV213_108149 [Aureibacillus halotolerans]